MTISRLRSAGAAILCAASAIAAAAPQPIERFARRPQMYGVRSPRTADNHGIEIRRL